MPTDLPYSRYTRQSRFSRGRGRSGSDSADIAPETGNDPEPPSGIEPVAEAGPNPASGRQSAGRVLATPRGERLNPLIYAFFAAAILPVELTLRVGTLNMTPFKLIMLLVTIPALIQFFSRCRFTFLDGLFFAYSIYTVMCTLLNSGTAAIEGAGVFFMETVAVYAIVRVSIRSVEGFRAAVLFLLGVMLVLCLLSAPEALTFNRFLHNIPAQLTGVYYPQQNDVRFGMLRASSTFSHQILFGVAVAALVVYAWIFSDSIFKGITRLTGLAIGAFFSLSSAAWLLFIMQLALIAAERVTRVIPKRGLIILLLVVAAYIFVDLVTNRGPIKLLVSYMTLNIHSSYFRIQIWEHSIDDVWRSPLIGIVPSEWTRPHWMPTSIDNHWMVLTLRGGIPSLLFIATFIIVSMIRVAKMPYPGNPPVSKETGRQAPHQKEAWDPHKPTLDIRNGWILSTLALVLGGATVAYYGKMFPILTFYLALGPALLAMVDPLEQAKYAKATGQPERKVPGQETGAGADSHPTSRSAAQSRGKDRRR